MLKRVGRSELRLAAVVIVLFAAAIYAFVVATNVSELRRARAACGRLSVAQNEVKRRWAPIEQSLGSDIADFDRAASAHVDAVCASAENRLVWWRFNQGVAAALPPPSREVDAIERISQRLLKASSRKKITPPLVGASPHAAVEDQAPAQAILFTYDVARLVVLARGTRVWDWAERLNRLADATENIARAPWPRPPSQAALQQAVTLFLRVAPTPPPGQRKRSVSKP